MPKISIIVRNTHFVVTVPTKSTHVLHCVNQFNNNLITYKMVYMPHLKRMRKLEDRRYYYKVGKNTYHYSIHLLTTFVKRMTSKGINKSDFSVTYDKSYEPGALECEMNPGLTDREHQPLYIEKALNTNPMVLVDLKTGLGKTYISMRVSTELDVPVGIIILSRYIEKWIGDLLELTTVLRDKIYVVKGKDSLTKLLNSGEQYDFIIFSLSTLRNYIQSYDKGISDETPIAPEDMFKHLGLGMLLTDEVHQSFHAGYMTTIRLNPMKVLALSATLDNLDSNIRLMYATLYPPEARCGNLVTFDPYAIVIAVNQYIDTPNAILCKGPRGYSHTLFEKSIMKNHLLRKQYIDMVLHYVNVGWVKDFKEGDKLLILVQTIRMATLLTNYLSSRLNKYVVNRYVEEDPYSNIMDANITVSTNLSAGTALDIPNLTTVIQCVSMGSLQANVQALGRLRKIPDRDVKYYYLYSSSLPDQYRLHNIRKETLKPLVKEYLYEEYNVRLSIR